MSDTVIPFRPKTEQKPEPEGPAIAMCDCGCITHFVREDGVFECASCGTERDDLNTVWLDRMKDAPRKQESPETPMLSVIDIGPPDAAFRRLVASIRPQETVAVVVVTRAGTVRTWDVEIATPEQKAWLKEKLDTAFNVITGEGGDGNGHAG